MKTVIKGKNIYETYEIERHDGVDKDGNVYYDGKPCLKFAESEVEWIDICDFKGDFVGNKHSTLLGLLTDNGQINISESESVTIQKTVFRADLNEQHVFTDKVFDTFDNKKDLVDDLQSLIMCWNYWVIENVPKLKAYCDLHSLDYSKTDVEELISLLYEDGDRIVYTDNKGVVVENPTIMTLDLDNTVRSYYSYGINLSNNQNVYVAGVDKINTKY